MGNVESAPFPAPRKPEAPKPTKKTSEPEATANAE